jgi:hypothetical protein
LDFWFQIGGTSDKPGVVNFFFRNKINVLFGDEVKIKWRSDDLERSGVAGKRAMRK